jgi:hypothetical protein
MRVGDKIAPLHHPIFKPANLPDFLAVARNMNHSLFLGQEVARSDSKSGVRVTVGSNPTSPISLSISCLPLDQPRGANGVDNVFGNLRLKSACQSPVKSPRPFTQVPKAVLWF